MLPQSLVEQMSNVILLDVRYPNEWEAGHIRGAIHVPLDYLSDHLEELDRSRLIVTVCRSGQRSDRAAQELRDEGFEAENLDGGMLAWTEQDLAVIAADGTPGTIAEPEEPPDDRPPEMQRLQNEFLDVIFAVKEHFGDREPNEDEIHAFLKDRLIAEGKTPEEAEEFLDSNE